MPPKKKKAKAGSKEAEIAHSGDEDDENNWRLPDVSKQLPAMLKLIPVLTSENFEDWLKGLQMVAAQFGWYDPDTKEEWTPEAFADNDGGETVLQRRQRITCFTLIVNTSTTFKYLHNNVNIGDASSAYLKICSLLNRSTMAGLIEASQKFVNSSMASDKLSVGEFSAIISQRAKLVRKRGGVAPETQMVTLLLNGLLPEFKPFKTITLSKPVAELSFDSINESLLDFARANNISDLRYGGKHQHNIFFGGDARSPATLPPCRFFAKGTCNRGNKCRFPHGNNGKRQLPSASRPTSSTQQGKPTNCDYCMRPGHSAKHCFKRRKEESRKAKNKNATPSVLFQRTGTADNVNQNQAISPQNRQTGDSSQTSSSTGRLVSFADEAYPSFISNSHYNGKDNLQARNSWIADSGCNQLVTNDKDDFVVGSTQAARDDINVGSGATSCELRGLVILETPTHYWLSLIPSFYLTVVGSSFLKVLRTSWTWQC